MIKLNKTTRISQLYLYNFNGHFKALATLNLHCWPSVLSNVFNCIWWLKSSATKLWSASVTLNWIELSYIFRCSDKGLYGFVRLLKIWDSHQSYRDATNAQRLSVASTYYGTGLRCFKFYVVLQKCIIFDVLTELCFHHYVGWLLFCLRFKPMKTT